ncbi:MAG: hypothetical protein AAFR61_01540 [Bacteroidota bacterium]
MATQEHEISQLKKALASLKKENEQLKIIALVRQQYPSEEGERTEHLKKDSTVEALRAQLDPLLEAQEHLAHADRIFKKVGNALEALVPALEVHIRGLNGEVMQLKSSLEDAENTYASVVAKLERQIDLLRTNWDQAEAALRREHRAEMDFLRKEIDQLKNQQLSLPRPQARPARRLEGLNPFTSLSIFGL